MNNKLAVKIVLDPKNHKTSTVTALQLLNKSGMDIGFHCKDGHCGYCKVDQPITSNITIKEGKSDLAYYDKEVEALSCISVLDKSVSELNPEGHMEIDFVIPINLVGKKLKEEIKNGNLQEDKMWVYDFANREAKIKDNTIVEKKEPKNKIKIKNI